MKLKKSQIKELIRHAIIEASEEEEKPEPSAPKPEKEKPTTDISDNPFDDKESVEESKKRRFTVKEVRAWMKKLEENRYKKVYNSDARRVAWMVNNEGVSLDEMPKSMSKKWTKAQYGRERYLAKEFLKSKSEQLSEGSLKQAMQQWKYIEKGLKPKQKKLVQKALKRLKPKMDKNFKNKDYQDYIDGELDIKVPLPDLIFGKGKEFAQLITAYSNAIKEPAFYEGKLTSEQKLRSMIRGIIEEQIRHTNARFLYVPKNDFKKAKNIFKSDIKKGRVEIEPKPSPKVKGFYRMTVNKQDFDDYVEELMMKRINVKTIAQGKA